MSERRLRLVQRHADAAWTGGLPRLAIDIEREVTRKIETHGRLTGQINTDVNVVVANLIGAGVVVAKSAVETVQRVRDMSPRERAEGMADALSKMGWHCEPPEGWSSAEVVENGNGAPHP